MAINLTDVPITDGVPITDLSTPAGFSPVIIWAYDEFFSLPANPDTSTLSFQLLIPTQTTADQWQALFDGIRGAASGLGYDLLAYGVWEQPAENIAIPDQICFFGTSTCLTVPPQLCFPVLGCIDLAGTTLVSGFWYQVWVLADQPGVVGPYRAAGQVRGQIGIAGAIAILILIFGALIGIVALQAILTGHLTLAQLQGLAEQWLTAPGRNLVQAELPAVTAFVVLGVAMVIAGVAVPALALSGNVGLPGGAGVGGGISTGIPTPTRPASGRRTR